MSAAARRIAADRPRSPIRGVVASLLSALLVLAAIAGPAHAQEWRYRVRPGDTLWDLGRAYLRDDVPWERLQAHNGIADPWNMPPGTQIRVPVPWLRVQPAQATVLALRGEATAHPADAPDRAVPVQADMRLGAGTVLRTAEDANLTLAFADGSRLQLHGDSELRLDRLSAYGATGMVDSRMRLIRGRTTNAAQRARGPASRFVVDTPGAMATVRGTRFRVGHRDARTYAEVLEGRVGVSGGGRSVLLGRGQGSVSEADRRPRPPTPLLAAPDLSGWPLELTRMPAALEWPAVEGAQRYRVEVAPDPEFLTLLQEAQTDAPSARIAVPGDGTFHARVRAVDAAGLEGRDAVRSFVVAAHPVPPFAISPAEDDAPTGPRPRFRWTRSEDGVRYRVQVARDPSFSAPLLQADALRRTDWRAPSDLEPGTYYWRVGAVDADGRAGPYGDPTPFSAAEAQPGPAIGEDGVVRSRRELQVRWPAGAEGQRYGFQLARDPTFADLALETELEENRIVLPDLRAGTWYMRTRLIDDDGYAHPYGPAQSVRIGCLPCRIAVGAGLLLLVL